MKRGLIVVVSAPSGTGKSAVLNKVMDAEPQLKLSVSATTRAPRPGEQEGEDYYFLSRSAFESHIVADAFVEFAEVHGNFYGTLKSELDRLVKAGQDVILELDVQGMRNIRRTIPEMISIFLMPPTLQELANRLRKRGTETEEAIALRLKNAEQEIAARLEFDYIVVNDTITQAAADLRAILRAEHCRTRCER